MAARWPKAISIRISVPCPGRTATGATSAAAWPQQVAACRPPPGSLLSTTAGSAALSSASNHLRKSRSTPRFSTRKRSFRAVSAHFRLPFEVWRALRGAPDHHVGSAIQQAREVVSGAVGDRVRICLALQIQVWNLEKRPKPWGKPRETSKKLRKTIEKGEKPRETQENIGFKGLIRL